MLGAALVTTVRVYYNKCDKCGSTWSTRLSQADVIRIGKETFICKCGTAWPTGYVEWAHLTPRQRRSYFLSTAEIGLLILCPFVGGLFSYFIALNKRSGLVKGVAGGLVTALVWILVMWTMKFVFVLLSLRRHPLNPMTIPTASGFLGHFTDAVGTGETDASTAGEKKLRDQLHSIGFRWLYLLVAAACLPWIRYTWPVLFLSLILFMRSLRKLP